MAVKRNAVALALLFLGILMVSDSFAKPETGFLNRTVKIGKTAFRYQVYVPAEWNKGARWPVVLFLHGAGEHGEDGLLQTQVGIGPAIRLHRERFACIVVMPQCRESKWWADPAMEAQALAALDQSLKEFKGDPSRVYLTGISMGGYGTWSLAAKHPERFAALSPVCGGIRPPARTGSTLAAEQSGDPYAAVASKVGKTPVWIFHGGADNVVPVTESRKMNEALIAAGGNVKYSEYEGVGHNSWDRAYADPDFMKWILAQRKVKPGPHS